MVGDALVTVYVVVTVLGGDVDVTVVVLVVAGPVTVEVTVEV